MFLRIILSSKIFAMQFVESQPMFQRRTSLPSSFFISMKMEVICSSEMFADFERIIRRYLPEDRPFHS
jgi:hypothetical protein